MTQVERQSRIGVVGAGWWATETHIPALLANPHADLVALCDTDSARLARAAEHFEIERTYTDVDRLLACEELDGALIVTNHAYHHPVARRCLEQGLHLMVEKPLTVYAPDAQDLVELARAQGREIVMGYPYNYLPFAVQVREMLAAGELGEVQYANAMFNSPVRLLFQGKDNFMNHKVHGPGDAYADTARSAGGHGHTQLTHIAGLLFFLTQLRPVRVQSFMQDFGLPVEVAVVINAQFTNDAVGVVSGIGDLGGSDAGYQNVYLYCTEGVVKISTRHNTCMLHRPGREPEALHHPDGHTYRGYAPSQNLVDICLGRDVNRSPVEAGLRAVELLHAAYESAAVDGCPINVKDLYQ